MILDLLCYLKSTFTANVERKRKLLRKLTFIWKWKDRSNRIIQSHISRYISLGIFLQGYSIGILINCTSYVKLDTSNFIQQNLVMYSLTCKDHPSSINLKIDHILRNKYAQERLSCRNNYGHIFFHLTVA